MMQLGSGSCRPGLPPWLVADAHLSDKPDSRDSSDDPYFVYSILIYSLGH